MVPSPIIDSLAASILASGTITAVIISIGVQVFFRTNSFESEYREKVKAICEMKNSLLVNEIETAIATDKVNYELKKLVDETKNGGTENPEFPFDEGSPIREFETLASIRELAWDVERWVTIIEDGKQKLRKLGGALIIFGLILGLTFFVMILTEDFGLSLLLTEYFSGIPAIVALHYTRAFVRLQRKIDLEYINVGRRQVGNTKRRDENQKS